MALMLPRRLLPWLFALALFIGQATAFAHALSHLDPHEATVDATCELSVGHAPLGSGAVGKAFVPAAEAAAFVAPPAAAIPPGRLALRYAHARAPPVSV
jgi:hypothetical protein